MHLVAYFSQKMSLAEQNYNIYEKELIAIVYTLIYQKIYLQGARFPVTVLSDYLNLRTFTTTKVINNRRIARQIEILANFDFIIKHIKGTDNPRADALSRKPGYEEDKRYKEAAILKVLENRDLAPTIREIAAAGPVPPDGWYNRVMTAQREYEKEELRKERPRNTDFTSDNLVTTVQGKTQIPKEILHEFILDQHSLPAHGHQGIRRTFSRINRNCYAEGLRKAVTEVVSKCDTCIRNKPSKHAPYRQIGITTIFLISWKSIS